MLIAAADEVAGDADVEYAVASIGHDVDEATSHLAI